MVYRCLSRDNITTTWLAAFVPKMLEMLISYQFQLARKSAGFLFSLH